MSPSATTAKPTKATASSTARRPRADRAADRTADRAADKRALSRRVTIAAVAIGVGTSALLATFLIGGGHQSDPLSWSVVVENTDDPRLHFGALVIHQATLLPCPHGHGWLDRLWSTVGAAPAGAGHGDDSNSTTAAGPTVLDLTDPEPVQLGEAATVQPSHCAGHFTVGRSRRNPGPTFTLAATIDGRAVDVETQLAWGRRVDELGAAESGTARIHIDVSAMLDGIDPATTGDELQRSALRALAAAVTIDG